MRNQWLVFLLIGATLPAASAWAQFGTPLQFQKKQGSTDVERERTQRWKVGIKIAAATGPCSKVRGTFSVPIDWPEQDVKVVEENISDTVRQTAYRNLDEGVRRMVFLVPRLNFGETAEVTVTFEITRRTKPIPLDTAVYHLPKTMPRAVRKCLANSPMIDVRNTKIRMKSKDLTADKETAWEKAEAIYDWIKENVKHTNSPLQGAVKTFDQKTGGHEDLANLFIALCRASKIPARTVWVPNYCYAEFYLEGEDKKGEWFPCEFKEKTEFATVSQPYMILQKGDNVQVPEAKERMRFVPEFVKAAPGSRPAVTTVRKTLGIK